MTKSEWISRLETEKTLLFGGEFVQSNTRNGHWAFSFKPHGCFSSFLPSLAAQSKPDIDTRTNPLNWRKEKSRQDFNISASFPTLALWQSTRWSTCLLSIVYNVLMICLLTKIKDYCASPLMVVLHLNPTLLITPLIQVQEKQCYYCMWLLRRAATNDYLCCRLIPWIFDHLIAHFRVRLWSVLTVICLFKEFDEQR